MFQNLIQDPPEGETPWWACKLIAQRQLINLLTLFS